ncbi:hypothetical protein D3C71_1897800 [compost metagenome]
MLRAVLIEVDRVQPQRREQPFIGAGQVPYPLEIRLVHPQHHHALHPARRRIGQQARAIGVEVGEVQVSVGVDQAHAQAGFIRCLKVRPMACTPGS